MRIATLVHRAYIDGAILMRSSLSKFVLSHACKYLYWRKTVLCDHWERITLSDKPLLADSRSNLRVGLAKSKQAIKHQKDTQSCNVPYNARSNEPWPLIQYSQFSHIIFVSTRQLFSVVTIMAQYSRNYIFHLSVLKDKLFGASSAC